MISRLFRFSCCSIINCSFFHCWYSCFNTLTSIFVDYIEHVNKSTCFTLKSETGLWKRKYCSFFLPLAAASQMYRITAQFLKNTRFGCQCQSFSCFNKSSIWLFFFSVSSFFARGDALATHFSVSVFVVSGLWAIFNWNCRSSAGYLEGGRERLQPFKRSDAYPPWS